MTKKAINNPERIVDEVIEGIVFASHGRLTKVPGVRALMQTHIEDGKVALLIGGGSGHEPIYTTYVGPGFAAASACGNIFAAPSPEIIFEATKAIHRGKGVLYVYGNYEGDVMNFDVAAEMAADEGIEVRTVRTMDDVSLPKGDGRRGIAGSYFQVKIAGAACAAGLSLDEAERVTKHAQENIRTLSVALRPGSLPETGQPTFTLGEDELEIGMGGHGERGVARKKDDARRSARGRDDGAARRRLSAQARRPGRAPRQRPRRDDDDGAADRQPKSEADPRTARRRRP